MSAFFKDFAANEALCQRLGNEILASTLSHAYILHGPRGSGKHTLAYQIAAALSCERKHDGGALPCGKCPSCKKILEKNSPDVIVIGREDKATLGVDAIRKLKTDIYVAPNDTSVKLYIIEDAHLMTTQAQNAFLLSFEEPPEYVLFLLLCESTETLLETIRSRAQILHMEAIPQETMDDYLCRTSADARALKAGNRQEYYEVLATANGCIGTALTLLSPEARKPLLERRERARQFVRFFDERKNSMAVLKYLTALGSKRDELIEQMEAILLCLRDLLICKQTDTPFFCFFSDAEDAHALAYRFTTPELLSLCNTVNQTIDRLRANANVRLTLTALAANAGIIQI